MKKAPFFAILFCIGILSCSKNETPTPPTAALVYMNSKPGSLWNYEVVNNTPPPSTSLYGLTSTSKDTAIGSKSYHVYTNTATRGSEYYHISGSDYYSFQSLPAALGGSKVENLYLKAGATVGSTWSQPYNISFNSVPLTVTVVNKIEGKGISRTVNGVSYNNVIHVSTSISVAGVPPTALVTDIDYYYAPNFGLIENSSKINFSYVGIVNNSDFATRLKTATLL